MNFTDIEELARKESAVRVPIGDFLPYVRGSIDMYDNKLDQPETWLSLFEDKMVDPWIPAIIRSVMEADDFVNPIGIGITRDYWDCWDSETNEFLEICPPKPTLTLGNGHHRLMIGVLSEVLIQRKMWNVLPVQVMWHFTRPLVEFGNYWPYGSTVNQALFQHNHFTQSEDYQFFGEKVLPNLPYVEDYIRSTIFADQKQLVTA